MQSRRHDDFSSESSYGRSRRSTDLRPDSYLMTPPHSKRSWSPRRIDAPAYGRRSASLERRRFVDDGSRRIRSRSPQFMEAKRSRPYYNEDWVSDRDLRTPEQRSRYDFFNHMDSKHDADRDYSPRRNEYGYGRVSSRTGIIDDKFEGRRLDSGMRELPTDRSAVTGLYRLTGEMGPTGKPETGLDLSSASLNMGLGQHRKERVQYPDVQDSFSYDKYTNLEHVPDPRDASYSNLTAARSKESVGASHFKDYARTSPRKSRVDHLSYRGGIPLPRDTNHPLGSMHIPESLSHTRYEQRQHIDVNEDMGRNRPERFSPPRTGHVDSFRGQPRVRERDDYLSSYDGIYEKMNLHERMDYNRRDILKQNPLDHVTRVETSDFAHSNLSITAGNNIGLTRSPAGKRENTQYLDPVSIHSRLGRKILREQEMEIPYMGMSQDHEMERVRVNYDLKRDVGPGSHKERMRKSPGFLYERDHKMERHDLSPYDSSSSRVLKRKYTMEDEENRINSRTMMSRLDNVNRRHNRDANDDEWIHQDSRGSNRRHKIYDDEGELSYHEHDHEHEEFMHDDYMRSYKYEDKYANKGYSRSGNRGGYNSNRRNVVPKWKNDENEMYSGEIEKYEAEPHEDTDEFKKLVNDYFLSFTKKLNENTSLRRKYMEHGRAGSLFCIVCGRSLSKEFLDTQRLAMHAFMSHKGGLRAQHLGLVKAICVMLGWNSVIPAGTVRWFPEPVSTSEKWAQKEDLIIWPPVVIVHNISITNNDSNGQGPTTVEALGQFLRGIGLSGGQIKVGKPANCSIMLVKFLGTFSGLQEAKKIHEYFSKKKHGRKHLDQITSSKGKSTNSEDKDEAEGVVFGYMGIAEDLDKVDSDTKRKCSIKSKKEIQDLADDPVKPN